MLVAAVGAFGPTTGACGTRTSRKATERLPTRSRRTLSAATLAGNCVGGPMRISLTPVWSVTASPSTVALVTWRRTASGSAATSSSAGWAAAIAVPGAGVAPAPITSGRPAGRSGRSARTRPPRSRTTQPPAGRAAVAAATRSGRWIRTGLGKARSTTAGATHRRRPGRGGPAPRGGGGGRGGRPAGGGGGGGGVRPRPAVVSDPLDGSRGSSCGERHPAGRLGRPGPEHRRSSVTDVRNRGTRACRGDGRVVLAGPGVRRAGAGARQTGEGDPAELGPQADAGRRLRPALDLENEPDDVSGPPPPLGPRPEEVCVAFPDPSPAHPEAP